MFHFQVSILLSSRAFGDVSFQQFLDASLTKYSLRNNQINHPCRERDGGGG